MLSVPAEQLPSATEVGPVLTLAHVTTGTTPGALGVQLPAGTFAVLLDGVQTVCVHWLPAEAATGVQAPGATVWTALLLLVQLVTT